MTSSRTDLPIICFHGSPGTADDFAQLQQALPERELIPLVRRGYPPDPAPAGRPVVSQGDVFGAAIFCGYSWGGLACLRDAVIHPAPVGGVILIAPYLFPGKTGLLRRAAVGAPLLGQALLRRKGSQIVEELLVKTSHPAAVPPSYRALAGRLSRPEVLRLAVQEKERPGLDAREALRTLAERKVPLALIWGAQDQTAPEAEQVEPIKELCPRLFKRRFDDGGHALLWTHPEQLAEQIRAFLAR